MSAARRGERNDILYWCACRLAEAAYPKTAWGALAQVAETTGLPVVKSQHPSFSTTHEGTDQ